MRFGNLARTAADDAKRRWRPKESPNIPVLVSPILGGSVRHAQAIDEAGTDAQIKKILTALSSS
ncbi:MAG: hypothetical protein ACN4GT_11100 [Gammaproteobacteria bacterium]